MNNSALWLRRVSLSGTVAVIAILAIGILSGLASVSLGNLVSEKLLGRTGVTNSSMILGSQVNNSQSVFGFAPDITTQAQIVNSDNSVTLRGTVTDMNGMPSAKGYFEWGYTPTSLGNTTSEFDIAGVGNFSDTIAGFHVEDEVFYRFVVYSDGNRYGNSLSFFTPASAGGIILKGILRILLAVAILVGIIKTAGKDAKTLLIASMIGLVAFVLVDTLILSAL